VRGIDFYKEVRQRIKVSGPWAKHSAILQQLCVPYSYRGVVIALTLKHPSFINNTDATVNCCHIIDKLSGPT
jgi:hypothetical protein